MTVYKKFFERQDWHFAILALLLALVNAALKNFSSLTEGEMWGVGSAAWIWVGILAAVLHQVYVMLIWRIQLETGWLSKNLSRAGYIAYLGDFIILLSLRAAAVVVLSVANRELIPIPVSLRLFLSLTLAAFSACLFHTLVNHYGLERAAGADHFNPSYLRKPPRQKGMLRHGIRNFYILGPLALYIPGLLLASPAALFLALFNHLYAGVHYYCTELPDIKRIHGHRAD